MKRRFGSPAGGARQPAGTPPGGRHEVRARSHERGHGPRTAPWRVPTAAIAVLSLVLAVLSLLSLHPAAADTVGAGSYTTTPVGSLPSGCGSISTNPREWVTPNAPAGAVPTNDWWSSILWKRTNCSYGEPMMAHPLGFRAGAGGLGFSYTTTPTISGTATGVGEYHFPYTEDFVAGVTGLNAQDELYFSQITVEGLRRTAVAFLNQDAVRNG